MWKVVFSSEAELQVRKLDKENKLNSEDKEVISTWIKQVQEYGPASLREGVNFWHDHDLVGKWKGYRTSAYGYKGGIIYKVEDKKMTVIVVELTATHDYS